MTALSFSAPRAAGGFAGYLALALRWPARVLEARDALARWAELSERERQDIGGVRSDDAFQTVEESPAERQARLRAVRAWYGHEARAA